VDLLCASGQQDMIDAARHALGSLVNGATALRYMRMHPGLSAEATQEFLHAANVRRQGGRKQ
jgi:hypothetical protein